MLSIRQAVGLLSARTIIRAVGAGFAALCATVAILGLSADLIANPWFERRVPVHTFDWVVLVTISVLTGALVGTYFLGQASMVGTELGVGSGVTAWFAVSCPLCNKVVLLLLGTSGAASLFEPIQPLLGAFAVALALVALRVRVRMLLSATCPLPTPPPSAPPSPRSRS
jgi:hypothetical protein